MKAAELRIGNWVWFENIPMDIKRDIMKIVAPDVTVCKNWPTNFEPVKLTPKVLEATELIFEGRSSDYSHYVAPESKLMSFHFSLMKPSDDIGYVLHLAINAGMFTNRANKRPIKYLHELQNLYYVLTGQELEVNEELLKQAV